MILLGPRCGHRQDFGSIWGNVSCKMQSQSPINRHMPTLFVLNKPRCWPVLSYDFTEPQTAHSVEKKLLLRFFSNPNEFILDYKSCYWLISEALYFDKLVQTVSYNWDTTTCKWSWAIPGWELCTSKSLQSVVCKYHTYIPTSNRRFGLQD